MGQDEALFGKRGNDPGPINAQNGGPVLALPVGDRDLHPLSLALSPAAV